MTGLQFASSFAPADTSRVQTTGSKLAPPKIRIERSRCIQCGGAAELTCKQCHQDTVYCLKCGRRAKHQHPLKAFRRRDEDLSLLRKHLTLSYYEHIVACNSDQCMQTCHESRYARSHFHDCKDRPVRLADIIENGSVRFDDTSCCTCGLFITCMFLHADKCRETTCSVEWCDEIRATFEMGVNDQPVYMVTKEMEKKCRDVHRVEWSKVEERRRDALLEDLLAISL